jgi:HPt (histidine-containing phosphotransfer) domain-containing protein
MNFKELADNLKMEMDEFFEILQLFIETTASDLGQLQMGINEGNPEKVVRAAHSMKGASATLGLMEISELSRRIETNGRESRLEGSMEVSEKIRKKLNEMEDMLMSQS